MIVVLGGTGLLGIELNKLDKDLCCSGREIDITNYSKLQEYLDSKKPTVIVNAAAVTDSTEVLKDPVPAIDVNIVGAANVAKYCSINKIRLVYISTDYVYTGTGNHRETDPLLPNNSYAWTKLGGECSSRLVTDYCIIRTSFGSTKFPYPGAYVNLFSSKEYVDVIAPKILSIVKSQQKGVINVGGSRKSLYLYAKERNEVKQIKLSSTKDFSLNTEIYDNGFRTE